MAIDKKLIHFNTKDIFDQKKDQIKDTSIVFVKDANMIYTHGEEYRFIEWGYLGTVGEESGGSNLITFTINGTEYQAEEGMTFYDWAISEYYDSSCNLCLLGGGAGTLRDNILNGDVSPGDSSMIFYGAGAALTPYIYTDTIIEPISYTSDFGDFD